MKKLLFFISLITLSCRNEDDISKDNKDNVIDIIAKSDSIHNANDSIINKVVDETSKKIENLQKQVKTKNRKQIIYRVDTIYIKNEHK